MPIITTVPDAIAHLRRALSSRSQFVVIGEEAAEVVVMDLAAKLPGVTGIPQSQITFGRFAYAQSVGDEPFPVSFVTFSTAKVARDTVSDLLLHSGVQLAADWSYASPQPPAPVLLSDNPRRLESGLRHLLAASDAQLLAGMAIASPRASCAFPAPARRDVPTDLAP